MQNRARSVTIRSRAIRMCLKGRLFLIAFSWLNLNFAFDRPRLYIECGLNRYIHSCMREWIPHTFYNFTSEMWRGTRAEIFGSFGCLSVFISYAIWSVTFPDFSRFTNKKLFSTWNFEKGSTVNYRHFRMVRDSLIVFPSNSFCRINKKRSRATPEWK